MRSSVRIFYFSLMWLYLSGSVNGAVSTETHKESTPSSVVESTTTHANKGFRYEFEHIPFGPGEKFEFVIKYEFLEAGSSTLEVIQTPNEKGGFNYQFISEAKSSSFIDNFFKVRDYNSAIVDAKELSTLSFHQNLNEGHYKVIRNIRLDYDKKIYTYDRIKNNNTTTKEGPLEGPVTDILSAFFYTRALPLKLGESYEIRVFSDLKIYALRVSVDNKLDTVRVPAGKFECLKIEPHIEGDAIFKLKDGRMTIWLSNDARRIPVLIRSKVAIGAFDAELKKFSGQ